LIVTAGIIADTHDWLDPLVFDIFAGVDRILHAGDVEDMGVIRRLEKIAPVIAVAGNHESPEVTAAFPWLTTLHLGGVKIALTHQFLPLNIPNLLPLQEGWASKLGLDGAQALVFGHTHEPVNLRIGDILYFNPGFAGPEKMEPVRTVGLLKAEGNDVSGEVYFLSPPPREEYFKKAKIWKPLLSR